MPIERQYRHYGLNGELLTADWTFDPVSPDPLGYSESRKVITPDAWWDDGQTEPIPIKVRKETWLDWFKVILILLAGLGLGVVLGVLLNWLSAQ